MSRVDYFESHELNIKNIQQKEIQHNEHPMTIRVFILLTKNEVFFELNNSYCIICPPISFQRDQKSRILHA